ncbi:MAG: hypothetical protein ACI3X4_07280, partial [Bacteroidaceae bacterium]
MYKHVFLAPTMCVAPEKQGNPRLRYGNSSLQGSFVLILEKIPQKRANWEKIKIQLEKIFFPIGKSKLGISEKRVGMVCRNAHLAPVYREIPAQEIRLSVSTCVQYSTM